MASEVGTKVTSLCPLNDGERKFGILAFETSDTREGKRFEHKPEITSCPKRTALGTECDSGNQGPEELTLDTST